MKLVTGLLAILSLVIAGSNLACAPNEREDGRDSPIPEAVNFPQMSREYSWTSPPSVKESIDRVLTERGFYYLWERDEKTLRFRTSFAPLTNLDSPIHLKGQIALLITLLDYEMGEPKQEIRIRWIVMERRQLTAQYRISQDPSVLSTAARFVDSFVEDMRRVKPLR